MQVKVLSYAVRLPPLLAMLEWGGEGDVLGATVLILRPGSDPAPDNVLLVAGDAMRWQGVPNVLRVDVWTRSNVRATAVLDTNTAGNILETYNQTFPAEGLINDVPSAQGGQYVDWLLNYGTLFDVSAGSAPVRFYIPWAD